MWLAKIEREYSESRAGGDGGAEEDAWKGGNINRRPVVDSDDESEDDDNEDKDGDVDEDGGVEIERDPLDISSDSDDEEEMAELRRKVLQSKAFTNPTNAGRKSQPEKITRPESLPVDSDADAEPDPDSDNGDDDAFDNIINATPITDRTGIQAKQRLKGQENISAVFSRTVIGAPKKW